MTALFRAELLKLRTTRGLWGAVAASVAFVPLAVALPISQHSHPLGSGEGVRNVMSAASSAGAVLLILGIMISSGEFRHMTASSTFLISPDRRRVIYAKLAAAGVTAVALTVLISAVTLAVAVPWLASRGVTVSSFGGEVAAALGGALLAGVVSAALGVGFGAVVRNQTAAITVALLWSQVVETLLTTLAPRIGRWLPGGAASALTGVPTPHGGLLPAWGAAILFTGYGLAFAFAGVRLLARRDIA